MHSKEELNFIKDFIIKNEDAKVYLGVDSQRIKEKKVKFATVAIIHFHDENGIGKGAKIFEDITFEDVIDSKLSRPFNRMYREVELVTELYDELEDVLIDKEFEIHLDISVNKDMGSNVAYNAAKGLVYGLIGVEPIFKPDAFAASCCADKFSK